MITAYSSCPLPLIVITDNSLDPGRKYIFFTGIILMLIGAVIWFFGNKFSWFGNLPGDLKVEKENSRFYLPFTSMILLSVAISFLIWLFRKIFQ